MDNDKIINELKKFIKDYKEKDQINTKEFRDSLSKTLTEILNEEISDEEIIKKFYDSFPKNKYPIGFGDIAHIDNLKYKKPLDVVNGMYYNKEKDSFDLYPFRVINVDKENGKAELLGLKFLGTGTWEEVKDMEFKFLLFGGPRYNHEFAVVTGRIPDKDRLVEIRNGYEKDLEGNDGRMLIGLGGNSYWTNNFDGTNGWDVLANGVVSADGPFISCGILPYVEVEI